MPTGVNVSAYYPAAADSRVNQRILKTDLGKPGGPAKIDSTTLAVLDGNGVPVGNPSDANVAPILRDTTSQAYAAVQNTATSQIQARHAVQGVSIPATISHADVQAALTAAQASGQRVQAGGSYTTDQTLLITSDCDLTGLTIIYTGSGVAVQVGDPSTLLFRRSIGLPRLIAGNKSGTGWAAVAGTVGVRVSNAYSCFIEVPHIQSFETGMLGHGQTPNGTSYCEITLGHIDNCKVGLQIAPQNSGNKATSGWFNQNTFIGGRISHNSNEGSQVTGTRNILISDCINTVNNNLWLNTAIESPDVCEYHIECYGQYNYWDRCRFENTGGDAHRRVWWRAVSKGNIIDGGFNAGHITEVTEAGAVNDIRSDIRSRYTGGTATASVVLLENANTSSGPQIRGLAAGATASGADPSSAWVWQSTGFAWQGKRSTDVNARLSMDYVNGRFYFGDGTAAPTMFIGQAAGYLQLDQMMTQTTAPAAGSAAALPATPAGYLAVIINGSTRRIAYY